MKKKIALILTAMLMLMFALTACGSKTDPIVGNWKATKMKMAGVDISLEEFSEQTGQDVSMSLEFTADGKIKGNAMGQTAEGDWKAKDGGKYDVTIDDETEELVLEDGLLTLGIEGVQAIFEKQ